VRHSGVVTELEIQTVMMMGMAVLEDEDINKAISTPEMGLWEGVIEVVVATVELLDEHNP
jgi:hypothetical protein